MSARSKCTIDDLPYEVLVEIFSYLSINDILSSAEQVCRRWKEACHDVRTWRNLTYRPADRDRESVLNCLSRMPKVQGLALAFPLQDDFLADVLSKCVYLRRLIFTECVMVCGLLRTIRKHCPLVEELQMKFGAGSCDSCLVELSQLENLKSLALTPTDDYIVATLKPLADKCSQLENISLGTLSVYKEDIVYFLEKKGSKLRQFQVQCAAVGECILPLLSACECLEQLKIVCSCVDDSTTEEPNASDEDYMDPPQMQSLHLQNLQTLNSLTLYCLNKFNPPVEKTRVTSLKLFNNLSHLVCLTIYLASDLKVFIDAIVENCPVLKRLYFARCSALTDYCLMNLPSLRFLEDVSLEGSSICSPVGISYLSFCPSLQYLNLAQCHHLAGGAIKKLVTLRNLRSLILDGCDVRGLPFHLIQFHMKNLTFLNLYDSLHLDLKALNKLRAKRRGLRVGFEPYPPRICICGCCPLPLSDGHPQFSCVALR